MARKKQGARSYVTMECTTCDARLYRTSKNNRNTSKLELSKYCRVCRKHTPHKERKK